MKIPMRDRILYVLLPLLLLFSSCRSNHGDIGYFFGQWSLKSMTVDGEEADVDVKAYFWKFQNNIIEIQKILEFHDGTYCLGTWEEADNILSLDFDHKEIIDGEENWVRYTPPSELGIPARTTSAMYIEKLTDSDMELRFERADGKVYRYTFKKLL